MANEAVAVTAVRAVDFPGGIRITTGTIDFADSTNDLYEDQGFAVSATKWGANLVGCGGRLPDFVIFNSRVGGAADTAALPAWFKSTGKVQLFGDSAIQTDGFAQLDATDDIGTVELDFLAIWINVTGAPAADGVPA